MRSTLLIPFLLVATPVLALARQLPRAPQVAGDRVLAPDTVAVVTSDGFFLPDPQSSTPLLFVSDDSFPGAPDFVKPAVQWEPGTDSFLVASNDQLFRVSLTSLAPAKFTIDDVTPSTAVPMKLFDLDVNPGTGELYLLDQATKTVERFQAPYAAGMRSDVSVPVPPTTRSIALDSRSIPPTLIAGETTQVTRVYLDGSTEDMTFLPFPVGVDQDPQSTGKQSTYMCSSLDEICRSVTSPSLVISMNFMAGSPIWTSCIPLALAPEDVEWDPIRERAFALAEDGTNPLCVGFSTGPNHVVRFPTAQVPGVVHPQVHTFPGGSGITGTQGDLAIVHGDFAFVTPYGTSCSSGTPGTMELDVGQVPVDGIQLLTVMLSGAPADTPATLVAGLSRSTWDLDSGCSMLTSPDFIIPLGTTNAQGYVELDIPLPPGSVSAGTDLFLQGVVMEGGGGSVSQGLMVHVGVK